MFNEVCLRRFGGYYPNKSLGQQGSFSESVCLAVLRSLELNKVGDENHRG